MVFKKLYFININKFKMLIIYYFFNKNSLDMNLIKIMDRINPNHPKQIAASKIA